MTKQENSPEFTILMPCLNEEETLGSCIKKAQEFIFGHNLNAEILLSNNGSTDASAEIAQNLGVRIVDAPVKGYGNALICGIKAARGQYVIMGDSDDSYDFTDLEPFIAALRDGYELVMGNRYLGGIDDGAMPFLHRYLGTPVITFIGKVLFGCRIGDFNCGLRGFDREKIMSLSLHQPGMEFASEMIVKASVHGLKLAEVPTKLHRDGRSRPAHLRTFHDGYRHLRFLVSYALKRD
jgi:glycosyltransferase involved in cell wall biosynthesis